VQFALSEEIINQVIFAMEDQEHDFVIDPRSGEILPAEQIDPGQIGSAFVALPEWGPHDGYNLMERFVSGLRNPIFRELLKDALSSGKGVFRNFKDELKKNKEIELAWFSFKEREMRRIIAQWYAEERELLAFANLGPEPEEIEDLVISDFSVRLADRSRLEAVLKLDKKAFAEQYPDKDSELVESFYQLRRQGETHLLDEESLLLVAETPRGEFAGFAWGRRLKDPLSEEPLLVLVQLAVVKHYRGLGLARLLMERFCQEAHDRGYARIRLELAGKALELAGFLAGLNFQPLTQTLELDLAGWETNPP